MNIGQLTRDGFGRVATFQFPDRMKMSSSGA